jgi:topoisomerase-4 subunit B
MPAAQLRETTMDPERRILLRVVIPDPANKGEAKAARETAQLVESLMGRRPELRLAFIQEKAKFVRDLDV